MTTDAPVISAKNVWKLFGSAPEAYLKGMKPEMSFDEIRADGYIAGVKDVSIEVSRGEMLVIMGLSGSGKSTLVRCFSRLHEITGGTIEVEGQDIMSLSEKELIELRRNKMGMVFQSFNLVDRLSVMENVQSGRLGRRHAPLSYRRHRTRVRIDGTCGHRPIRRQTRRRAFGR